MRRFAERNLVQMTSIMSITLINCVMMTVFMSTTPSTPFEFFIILLCILMAFWCFFPLQSFSFIMHSDVFIAWPNFHKWDICHISCVRACVRA